MTATIDRASLTALAKKYRLGCVEAEAELIALGTERVDELAVAFGHERATEKTHAHLAEVAERDGLAGIAERIAKHIEDEDRRDTAARREAARASMLRILDPSAVTTEGVIAACQTRAPFVIVPIDTGDVMGISVRALRAIARDMAKRGRDASWSIDRERGWLRVDWRTARSSGHIRFVVRVINPSELIEFAGDEEPSAFFDRLCAPPQAAAPAPASAPFEATDLTDAIDAAPSDERLAELEAEVDRLRAALAAASVPSAPKREATRLRAVGTKRARILARQPGECLRRNGGARMKHAPDCPGCQPA